MTLGSSDSLNISERARSVACLLGRTQRARLEIFKLSLPTGRRPFAGAGDSPDLVFRAGVPKQFWSVNDGWPLFKLAACGGAGAELNNENN